MIWCINREIYINYIGTLLFNKEYGEIYGTNKIK